VRTQALKDLGREALKPEALKADEVPQAFSLLAAMHSDADDRVITAWLEFLGEHGDRQEISEAIGLEAAQRLFQIADNADKPVLRNLAIAAIGKIRRTDFAKYLIRRLKEPVPSLRMLIVRSLGDQRSAEALEPLIDMQTSDPICRAEARAALEKLYQSGRIAFFGGQDLMAKSALRSVTDAMATYNSQMEEALDEMDGGRRKPRGPFAAHEDALHSKEAKIRLKAVYELGMTGDKAAVPLLLSALEDPDPEVGAAAAMAIAQTDPDGQLEQMKNGLSAASPALRGNAALALGFIKNKASLDLLLVALASEKDVQVKKRVIQGLAEMGMTAAVPGLEEAARNDPQVRPEVDAALSRLR
jgi:HEAT repeat protein